MIFVIAFGIANCKDNSRYHTDVGFCSYNTNYDTNYTIALVSLVIIIIMFISTFVSFFLFSKYSHALMSRRKNTENDNAVAFENGVNPINISAENCSGITNQQRSPNVIQELHVHHLLQSDRENLYQIDNIQSVLQPPPYTCDIAPPPYFSESTELSSPEDPENSMIPMTALTGSTHDFPPPYESVMYNTRTNQINFP